MHGIPLTYDQRGKVKHFRNFRHVKKSACHETSTSRAIDRQFACAAFGLITIAYTFYPRDERAHVKVCAWKVLGEKIAGTFSSQAWDCHVSQPCLYGDYESGCLLELWFLLALAFCC